MTNGALQPVSEGLRQVPAPAAKRLGAPGLAVKVQSKVSRVKSAKSPLRQRREQRRGASTSLICGSRHVGDAFCCFLARSTKRHTHTNQQMAGTHSSMKPRLFDDKPTKTNDVPFALLPRGSTQSQSGSQQICSPGQIPHAFLSAQQAHCRVCGRLPTFTRS